jgi:hypothetical protein
MGGIDPDGLTKSRRKAIRRGRLWSLDINAGRNAECDVNRRKRMAKKLVARSAKKRNRRRALELPKHGPLSNSPPQKRTTPMIRIYFLFDDPLDEEEVNLSFVDIPTRNPAEAFARVEAAAESGELWKNMYPDDKEHPYRLINNKMMYLDVSTLPHEHNSESILPVKLPKKARSCNTVHLRECEGPYLRSHSPVPLLGTGRNF